MSKSSNFNHHLEKNKPHLIECLERPFSASEFFSNRELESYCYLLKNLKYELSLGYLPQSIKQHIILGDIYYISPEDEGKDILFQNFIEDEFYNEIPLTKLSKDFLKRLKLDAVFLRNTYDQANKNPNHGLFLHGLIKILNEATKLPIYNITLDFLHKTCIQLHANGVNKVEQALLNHILNSKVLTLINFETDSFDERSMRYNGYLCSLITSSVRFKSEFPDGHPIYKSHATTHQLNAIQKSNQGDFIRFNSSIIQIVEQKINTPKNSGLRPPDFSSFI